MAVKYKLTITRYTETVTRRSFFRTKAIQENLGEWKTERRLLTECIQLL